MPARSERTQPARRFAKGRDSELRIIHAALEVFGVYSFDGATTRMIADHADVNLGSITYYFGNKHGVYNAVSRYVADELNKTLDEPLRHARELLKENAAPRADLIDALNDVFGALAVRSVGSSDSKHIARFIIREQLDPTASFEILFEEVMTGVNDVTSRLVGGILNRSHVEHVLVILVRLHRHPLRLEHGLRPPSTLLSRGKSPYHTERDGRNKGARKDRCPSTPPGRFH